MSNPIYTVSSPAALPATHGLRRWLRHLDRGLTVAIESGAALLLLAEIGVLLAGVVSRYVLQQPLVWSDELASMMFLWLSMFGAALALRRG
jgi:TRAP-type C4-dicarboxylate transport system permease small subunit